MDAAYLLEGREIVHFREPHLGWEGRAVDLCARGARAAQVARIELEARERRRVEDAMHI